MGDERVGVTVAQAVLILEEADQLSVLASGNVARMSSQYEIGLPYLFSIAGK